ncbi:hypothetical protein EC2872800_1012 [Escherichia coli 2872800]|nr:hypothetical protein SSJG_03970 [Escherichia coli D9]EMV25759.1 hypothetical protein ECBCE034MS14_1026 [Escherichia coli BCE034_MS-14]EMV41474.1 hypothetical protein EC2875000_0981 [Escherichia coli 2875000]EMV48346.1 hypothetical protein EC2872800_1012 [Escherichia coli 2872800]EMV61748.1 hypothetical protein EC2867750_0952 [Escherichia coli 2867750]EMV76998.1 hypothetical protein EC2866550_0974 [Escherichia coli 2866550]EMV77657.1 hypothetical protein EC2866450_0967 [Escherichia coli 286
MNAQQYAAIVHCRTGSLETAEKPVALMEKVHCRTGSLESRNSQ